MIGKQVQDLLQWLTKSWNIPVQRTFRSTSSVTVSNKYDYSIHTRTQKL